MLKIDEIQKALRDLFGPDADHPDFKVTVQTGETGFGGTLRGAVVVLRDELGGTVILKATVRGCETHAGPLHLLKEGAAMVERSAELAAERRLGRY